MNWKPWLDKGNIQQVLVSRKSLADLANIATRDLNAAQVTALSTDRRFAIAYNTALNLANVCGPKKWLPRFRESRPS